MQVHEGVLSIKAEHDEEHEAGDERFYRRERVSGSVSRRIALPGVRARRRGWTRSWRTACSR